MDENEGFSTSRGALDDLMAVFEIEGGASLPVIQPHDFCVITGLALAFPDHRVEFVIRPDDLAHLGEF